MISLWLKFKMQKNAKNDSRITIELFYAKTARKKFFKRSKIGYFGKTIERHNSHFKAKIQSAKNMQKATLESH